MMYLSFFFASGFAGGLEQEIHGGPLHSAEPSSVEQVDNDRYAHGQQTPKE